METSVREAQERFIKWIQKRREIQDLWKGLPEEERKRTEQLAEFARTEEGLKKTPVTLETVIPRDIRIDIAKRIGIDDKELREIEIVPHYEDFFKRIGPMTPKRMRKALEQKGAVKKAMDAIREIAKTEGYPKHPYARIIRRALSKSRWRGNDADRMEAIVAAALGGLRTSDEKTREFFEKVLSAAVEPGARMTAEMNRIRVRSFEEFKRLAREDPDELKYYLIHELAHIYMNRDPAIRALDNNEYHILHEGAATAYGHWHTGRRENVEGERTFEKYYGIPNEKASRVYRFVRERLKKGTVSELLEIVRDCLAQRCWEK